MKGREGSSYTLHSNWHAKAFWTRLSVNGIHSHGEEK